MATEEHKLPLCRSCVKLYARSAWSNVIARNSKRNSLVQFDLVSIEPQTDGKYLFGFYVESPSNIAVTDQLGDGTNTCKTCGIELTLNQSLFTQD